MESFTMATLVSSATELFTGAMSWVSTLLETIVSHPLYLHLFSLFSLDLPSVSSDAFSELTNLIGRFYRPVFFGVFL